jgi:phosphoheptose isomerase
VTAGIREHVGRLQRALAGVERDADALEEWGTDLARVLTRGGRLLAAGNGGSAAHAQHLTGELVGRYRTERRALSALALHAETTSLTAIVNDYGAEAAFARQVEAHGRPGDVLLLISTSGRSANLITAAAAGRREGLEVWGLSGPRPNPLAECCDRCLAVDADTTATIQEVHQVLVHLLCEAVDARIAARDERPLRLVGGSSA